VDVGWVCALCGVGVQAIVRETVLECVAGHQSSCLVVCPMRVWASLSTRRWALFVCGLSCLNAFVSTSSSTHKQGPAPVLNQRAHPHRMQHPYDGVHGGQTKGTWGQQALTPFTAAHVYWVVRVHRSSWRVVHCPCCGWLVVAVGVACVA
jgi:hypothetical protein